MDLVLPMGEKIHTNNGHPHATVMGFMTGMENDKKQFLIHVMQNVLQSKVLTHINMVACMDCSACTWHGRDHLPQLGNFVSFMGSILFFKDDIALMHIDDTSCVIVFLNGAYIHFKESLSYSYYSNFLMCFYS